MATQTASRVSVELPAEIFGVQTNVPLIHQVVVAQRTPKKMKAAALRGALSDRARHDRIHVVESLVTGDAPSTKAAKALLAGLSERKNLLIVLDRTDFVSLMSVRNLADVHVLAVDQLNTYDVLCADDVVFTRAAFEVFVSGGAQSFAGAEAEVTGDGVDAVAPAAFAAVAQAAAELPAGAAPSLEDGTAPEGYDIKGNADSGLYHLPGGRWYDATVAEFWFATEDEAKAAGFTKAGSKKKSEESK